VLGVCKTDQDCGGEDRGKCDNGTCVCGERFGGVTCSACRPGFEGANCSVACDCHGHGICTSSGTCECGRRWRGSDCTDRLCPRGRGGALCGSECTTCSGNGICSVSGACVCDSNWGGRNCSVLECGAGTRQSSNVSCQDCAPGSYKAWVGGGECNLCPRGKYSTQARATAESACVMCPENSYSEALGSRQASDCKCNVGYVPVWIDG
jgi:hypothetical protein